MKKITKKEVIESISTKDKSKLLEHFNTIYELDILTEHEYNQIYLAWLWSHGFTVYIENSTTEVDETRAEFEWADYELTFEVEDTGGVNLGINYDYYGFDTMAKFMNWKDEKN